MKRKIWQILTMLALSVTLISVTVSAAILNEGWEEATLEELRDAQQQLAARISELRKAEYDDEEAIVISGEGADIQTGIEILTVPSRVTFEGHGKLSLTGGDDDFVVRSDEGVMTTLFDEAGTFTALVEAKGEWTVTIEAIKPGDAFPLEGFGPFVSDFVELTEPIIVTVKAENTTKNYSTFYVNVHYRYKYDDAWLSDYTITELIEDGDELEETVILQPQSYDTNYVITVACDPGVEWSITPKK